MAPYETERECRRELAHECWAVVVGGLRACIGRWKRRRSRGYEWHLSGLE
jgi:hypothetical protein